MNDSIEITFPDKSKKIYPKGICGLEIAKSISQSLAKDVLSISINNNTWDATRPIIENADIILHTWKDSEGKKTFWHSSAHLLAEALESIYPGVKFGIGPPIENGFYYDVDFQDYEFNSNHFEKVEKKMIQLAREKNDYIRKYVSKEDAIDYFKTKGDQYKLELLNRLNDGEITFYQQGNFIDLCKGSHIPNTKIIKAIKLTSIAGAYWKGDINNKQLTRIYGISFPKATLLEEYLHNIEEAKKRDHRKIGKDLKLYTFSEKVGLGLPLWLPNGTIVREQLEFFLKNAQVKSGYKAVITPHIGHKNLYIQSGHYEKYGEDSFQPIKTPNINEEFILKPMNCPHHCEIYNSLPRSYKDLPLRLAEFGTVYRYEKHGELHGIARTRGFTQDDAHIFCTPSQVKTEIKKVIDLVLYVFTNLGFNDYMAQISLRDPNNPKKYIGDSSVWDQAESYIKEAANDKGLKTSVVNGEAAFYGPKLDFMVKDSLNRKWQLGTVQLDYQLPKRFELEYIGEDNKKHRPVMIHRAPFGSLERFISIILEHTEGKLPLWLAPTQVYILPISDKYEKYTNQIVEILQNNNIRLFTDNRSEKIGRKIRDAELNKIPFMIIIGEKEQNENKVSIRKHSLGDIGLMDIDDFIKKYKFNI